MIGLTSLWTNGRTAVAPELNRRRAVLVLGKIDEILSWEKTKEQEKDARFGELGQYLCEVRAGQYLMAIHEHLPRIAKPELRLMGWTKAKSFLEKSLGLTLGLS